MESIRMKHRRRNIAGAALSYLFGATFILSGVSKLISLESFGQVVSQMIAMLGMGGLSEVSNIISIALCFYEIILGAACFITPLRKFSSRACLLTMLSFTAITYLNYASPFGGVESCGCFGEIIHLNPEQSFIKNIILLMLSVVFVLTLSYKS